MKKLKAPVFAALILLTSVAQADLSYKWVSMTAAQQKAFADKCSQEEIIRVASATFAASMAAGVGLAGGLSSKEVSLAGGNPGGISIMGVMSAPVFGVAFAAAAYAFLADRVNLSQMVALVNEQQSGRPGLLTAELEQFAAENQLDGNRLLAALNLKAVQNGICRDVNKKQLDLEDLSAGQKAQELKKQEELIQKQLEEQTQRVLEQVNK